MDLHSAGLNRKLQISELEEWIEKAYHNARIYKERTKRWHDKRIKQKEFHPGNMVLLFISMVKLFGHGKLRSKWEGPYLVIDAMTLLTVLKYQINYQINKEKDPNATNTQT